VLFPGKHEDLRLNTLVIGAELLRILKERDDWESLESLFQSLTDATPVSLEQYYDAILFMWLAGMIRREGYFVRRVTA